MAGTRLVRKGAILSDRQCRVIIASFYRLSMKLQSHRKTSTLWEFRSLPFCDIKCAAFQGPSLKHKPTHVSTR
ncbi:hypothetical protein ALP98_103036 [Pseudomonas viridiflava]|uniref:Uncharacterized protein n=2 Tax=Pseudomonas syringae group TaxID=136849 RepID=A0A3M4JBN0_PSEVI|nr:hypothetical protein ALQ30_102435 [Pseudomonas syringae pv. persicae]RMQ14075.1 hypothetical protein ALQ09_102126 [Pseudomonas viridiflava]RMQ69042.1 hypothetical protein ALP98_103036 [Pseudomonas viridiflava]